VPVLTASATNSNNNNGIASTEFTLGTIYAQNNLVQLKLDGVITEPVMAECARARHSCCFIVGFYKIVKFPPASGVRTVKRHKCRVPPQLLRGS
jgi:hypothetical protein